MTFTPNPEQTKSIIRWFITAFGAGLAGWFAHSGFVTQQQVMDILNSPAFLTAATSLIGLVWGLFTHTQANSIATTDAIPSVSGVVMKSTVEGKQIADSSSSVTVAVAGTAAATQVAAK